MDKKKLISLLISIGVGLLITVLWWVGGLEVWESKVLDSQFKLRGSIETVPDVIIIAVDEKSIRELGRWPWQRSVHGRLVDLLTKAGAKTIIFDILFTEPDSNKPWADQYLGRVAKKSGKVVFGSFFQMAEGLAATPLMPIKSLRDNASTGFTNIFTELDGVNRRIPLEMEYQGKMVPSLSMAGLELVLNKTAKEIIEERDIFIDEYNEMMINFAGGYESFPYYSFCDVLNEKIAENKFKDKIILVGGTAAGLFDFKAIPYAPIFPGVEIHANAISNILLNNYLRPWSPFFTFVLIWFFTLLSAMVLGQLAPWKGGVSALGVFIGYFFFVHILFVWEYIDAAFVAPALSLSLGYVGVLFYRFMTEEKEKRWIKKSFNQYLSPQILDNILNNPGSLRLGGDRQNLSILFSDIRGFTTISESLNPEEVVELLNEYLTKMVEVVFRNQGTMDKFIGDAVMAFWGAPVPQDNHSQLAVNCAVEMIKELEVLQKKWESEGKKIINIGVGVNSGDVVVGNMGSLERMDYTVIGDNVNLASRLEGLTKEYKSQIIISEATYNEVKDLVDAEHLGEVKVKGKAKAVHIYGVLGKKGEEHLKVQAAYLGEDKKEKETKKHKTNSKFDPNARIEMHK
ncbi:MAG: CHASE2 domain-containing protein [Endomicrobiales bacterium]|nr:CHASE2 domain-containing protein [Endomicrobiales bacterium]